MLIPPKSLPACWKRYLLSCIIFVILLCVFMLFFRGKLDHALQIDVDMMACERSIMQIFWQNDGQFKEKFSLQVPVAEGRTQYTIQVPWQGSDMVLRMDMADDCENVELYSIDFSHPAYQDLRLDVGAILKTTGKSANISAPHLLPEGGIAFSTKNDPWFIAKLEMELKNVPIKILVTTPLIFFALMWLIFHPSFLKGNSKGGHLLLETKENALEIIESLQGGFHKLELIRSEVHSDHQSHHFSFQALQDSNFNDIFVNLIDRSEVISIRVQLNRSGEV